jgi:hypothetical protein
MNRQRKQERRSLFRSEVLRRRAAILDEWRRQDPELALPALESDSWVDIEMGTWGPDWYYAEIPPSGEPDDAFLEYVPDTWHASWVRVAADGTERRGVEPR